MFLYIPEKIVGSLSFLINKSYNNYYYSKEDCINDLSSFISQKPCIDIITKFNKESIKLLNTTNKRFRLNFSLTPEKRILNLSDVKLRKIFRNKKFYKDIVVKLHYISQIRNQTKKEFENYTIV